MASTIPQNLDVSEGQWFIVRTKKETRKKDDQYGDGLTALHPEIGLYEIPSKDEKLRSFLLKADIWEYLDPMRPYLKVINRDIWRRVHEFPGFMDFGSQEYSVVPHLLDTSALSMLVGDTKANAVEWKPGDKAEILSGPFKGAVGKVVKAGSADGHWDVEVSVFGMTKVVDVVGGDMAAPSKAE